MKNTNCKHRLGSLVLLSALIGTGALAQGCAAAAGAGAGAAGVAYFTSRGAKASVKGSPDELEAAAKRALSERSIEISEQKTDKGGAHRELKGKKGDLDVTVEIDRRDDTTSDVEVAARKNAVEWDKDYAESLLNSIIKRT